VGGKPQKQEQGTKKNLLLNKEFATSPLLKASSSWYLINEMNGK
jgi:hypothetical protein